MNPYQEYFTPGAILIAGIMISVSILLSNGITSLPIEGLRAATANAPVTNDAAGLAPVVTQEDYIRGNPEAPITIVEYSDFECPFCSRFHPIVKQIMAEYGNKVRWVYRHFPLTQIHPEAQPSAEAAECVAEQKGNDGFWQFTDAMFEEQATGLSADLYRQTAQQIGVDLAQFDDCVATRKYQEKVESVQAGGVALGVNGTPGSFINTTPVRGALPYANLKAIVEAELQKLEN